MPGNKKPRKRYRPAKTLILNTMDWVKEGLSALPSDYNVQLKIRYHDAFEMLRRGAGGFYHVDVLIDAFNIADALANGLRLGPEYGAEIRAAQDALFNVATRGRASGRFLFTGPEMTALVNGMEIHDAQLDACNVTQIERALAIVKKFIREKKARVVKAPEEQHESQDG